MICEECKNENLTSRVTPHGGSITAMYFAPYYDEHGKYHNHDGNTRTSYYSCSNGHQFSHKRKRTCPNCDWSNG